MSRIQNVPCPKALAYLKFMPHKGAKIASKVLQSAMANTLSNDPSLTEDELIIGSAIVEEGNRVKKIWPRARGRADILHKRYSHLIVRVDAKTQDTKVSQKKLISSKGMTSKNAKNYKKKITKNEQNTNTNKTKKESVDGPKS